METVTRRGFLGTTVTTVGVAGLGGIGASAVAAAEEAKAEPKKEKGMRVGMLTAPFGDETLETVADFAKRAGIACLEVVADSGSKQLDPANFGPAQADAVKKLLADRGLEISALACYFNTTEPGKTDEIQAHLKKMIDAAVLLGVPTICTQTGGPVPNMNKINTIKKVVPKVFQPVIAYAKDKNINVAVENYFETCLQGLDTFECLFETIKDDNFGLNYDPSHLVHQQCNHLLPVSQYAKRIFHTHGKDTLVDVAERGRLGVYARGWWRYVIPGFGNINWGEYISHLRMNGYDGVISIEHEDNTFSREQGFIHAARYLQQFC